MRDSERWVLQACDPPKPDPVRFHEHAAGDWTLALPPEIDTYRDTGPSATAGGERLKIRGESDSLAIAAYADSSTAIAGGLLSARTRDVPVEEDPVEVQRTRVKKQALAALGTISTSRAGGSFETHDGHRAAGGGYELETPKPLSTRELRTRLLVELAEGSFARDDLEGLPTTEGSTYRKFRVSVTVVERTPPSGSRRILFLIGVAPTSLDASSGDVRNRVENLVRSAHLAEAGEAREGACNTYGSVSSKGDFATPTGVLSKSPISHAIRVYVDGEQVPRSSRQGFQYRPHHNRVDIVGDRYQPETPLDECMEAYGAERCRCRPHSAECKRSAFPGEFVAIHYQTYR